MIDHHSRGRLLGRGRRLLIKNQNTFSLVAGRSVIEGIEYPSVTTPAVTSATILRGPNLIGESSFRSRSRKVNGFVLRKTPGEFRLRRIASKTWPDEHLELPTHIDPLEVTNVRRLPLQGLDVDLQASQVLRS